MVDRLKIMSDTDTLEVQAEGRIDNKTSGEAKATMINDGSDENIHIPHPESLPGDPESSKEMIVASEGVEQNPKEFSLVDPTDSETLPASEKNKEHIPSDSAQQDTAPVPQK